MKNIYKLLPLLFIAVLMSCDKSGGGGNDPSPELTALEKMQGTWKISSATRDGGDASSEFSGFSIAISQSSYTITNGGTAWVDTSGSISNFDSGSTSSSLQVTFSNNSQLSVTMEFSNDNKTLTLSFSVANNTFGGGRESGIAGSYVFVLNK